MTRAAAMIVVMVAGPGETRCRALKCLNTAPSLSAGSAARTVGCCGLDRPGRTEVLRGDHHTSAGALVALGIPGQAIHARHGITNPHKTQEDPRIGQDRYDGVV